MQRHLKKQQKRLKRENKKKENLKNKPINRYWPAIYCLEEKIFIGVSFCNVKPRMNNKVSLEHWKDGFAKFRDDKYKIDMSTLQKGDLVKCPHCNSKVDFRLWISTKTPEFIKC